MITSYFATTTLVTMEHTQPSAPAEGDGTLPSLQIVNVESALDLLANLCCCNGVLCLIHLKAELIHELPLQNPYRVPADLVPAPEIIRGVMESTCRWRMNTHSGRVTMSRRSNQLLIFASMQVFTMVPIRLVFR